MSKASTSNPAQPDLCERVAPGLRPQHRKEAELRLLCLHQLYSLGLFIAAGDGDSAGVEQALIVASVPHHDELRCVAT